MSDKEYSLLISCSASLKFVTHFLFASEDISTSIVPVIKVITVPFFSNSFANANPILPDAL